MTDLVGRIVGISQFHKMVPVDQRKALVADTHRRMDRTVWFRVTAEHRNDPDLLVAQNIHTGVFGLIARQAIHTSMTKAY